MELLLLLLKLFKHRGPSIDADEKVLVEVNRAKTKHKSQSGCRMKS
jgi:hypothetical protein